jgi:hypothetical protein
MTILPGIIYPNKVQTIQDFYIQNTLFKNTCPKRKVTTVLGGKKTQSDYIAKDNLSIQTRFKPFKPFKTFKKYSNHSKLFKNSKNKTKHKLKLIFSS